MGNKTAGQLAKEGSKLPQPPSTISHEEAKTLLKNTAAQEWQEEIEGYTFKNNSIHMLDRKGQTTLFRLRTGHCGLNKHLKKMGMAVWRDRTVPSPHTTNLPPPPTHTHFEEAKTSSLAYKSSIQSEAVGVWRRPTKYDQFL